NLFLVLAANSSMYRASKKSYIMTDSGGRLSINCLYNDTVLFPIGTRSRFLPAMIEPIDTFYTMGVHASVYDSGTTGNNISLNKTVVPATWHISGNVKDLILQWPDSQEMNG